MSIYQSLTNDNSILVWTARAIFQDSDRPLDLLPDRQWTKGPEDDDLRHRFSNVMNGTVLPVLNELARKHFYRDSADRFVRHFDWPHDNALVVVAAGTPNRSHGYFYLAVSLVQRDQAMAEEKCDGEKREEKRQRDVALREQEDARMAPIVAEDNRQRRQRARTISEAVEARMEAADHKDDDDADLEVGDHFYFDANQADRHAFVLAVDGDEAIAEYFMPQGRRFIVVVDREDHRKIRNYSEDKVPRKWNKAIVAQNNKDDVPEHSYMKTLKWAMLTS